MAEKLDYSEQAKLADAILGRLSELSIAVDSGSDEYHCINRAWNAVYDARYILKNKSEKQG